MSNRARKTSLGTHLKIIWDISLLRLVVVSSEAASESVGAARSTRSITQKRLRSLLVWRN